MMRTPNVVGMGTPFPGIPGAILYTSAMAVSDVSWQVGHVACVVIKFPTSAAKRYLVLDPLNTACVGADSVYRRRAENVNLVTRESVAAFFAHTAQMLRKTNKERHSNRTPDDPGYTFAFKTTPDADFEFAFPDSVLRAAIQRPTTDFDDISCAKHALANAQHTLVVPSVDHMHVLYSHFFAATPELESAPYNWCNHPFAAAIAKVCTRAGGPVQFKRGAFVFDRAFFACLAARLAHVMVAYLVSCRRSIWGLATFEAVFGSGNHHKIVFDTHLNSYVDAQTRARVDDPPSLKRRYVWVEPEELCGVDSTTKRTRRTLVSAFSRKPSDNRTRLANTPVLPACMTHALHLKSFPGLAKAQNDHSARARLAYLVHAIAVATGQPPLQAVDHSQYFASLRRDQIADYKAALKQGDRNKMSGPLCRNTERNVKARGLTCVKCPIACGRPNGIAVSELVDPNARPLTTMGILKKKPARDGDC